MEGRGSWRRFDTWKPALCHRFSSTKHSQQQEAKHYPWLTLLARSQAVATVEGVRGIPLELATHATHCRFMGTSFFLDPPRSSPNSARKPPAIVSIDLFRGSGGSAATGKRFSRSQAAERPPTHSSRQTMGTYGSTVSL